MKWYAFLVLYCNLTLLLWKHVWVVDFVYSIFSSVAAPVMDPWAYLHCGFKKFTATMYIYYIGSALKSCFLWWGFPESVLHCTWLSWCWVPFEANDHIVSHRSITVLIIMWCPLMRGQICSLSYVLAFVKSAYLHIRDYKYTVTVFTVFHIYMASASPGFVQQIMPDHT
jgi:hypothetical protein